MNGVKVRTTDHPVGRPRQQQARRTMYPTIYSRRPTHIALVLLAHSIAVAKAHKEQLRYLREQQTTSLGLSPTTEPDMAAQLRKDAPPLPTMTPLWHQTSLEEDQDQPMYSPSVGTQPNRQSPLTLGRKRRASRRTTKGTTTRRNGHTNRSAHDTTAWYSHDAGNRIRTREDAYQSRYDMDSRNDTHNYRSNGSYRTRDTRSNYVHGFSTRDSRPSQAGGRYGAHASQGTVYIDDQTPREQDYGYRLSPPRRTSTRTSRRQHVHRQPLTPASPAALITRGRLTPPLRRAQLPGLTPRQQILEPLPRYR